MNNSPTGESVETTGANLSPTSEEQQTQTPAEQTQETSSGANTQQPVSDDTANQTPAPTDDGDQTQTKQTGGDNQTDDGLAKFAKSQGVDDVSTLDENAQRFLKIAYDNQKAYRNSKNDGQSVADTAKQLNGTEDLEARIQNMEDEKRTEQFWSNPNLNRDLEASMVTILNEKKEQLGKEYAYNLYKDLDTLYAMAQIRNGNQSNVDAEAIRREERESIRQKSMASAPNAHAVSSQPAQTQTVTNDWIRDTYDPTNPEHIKMMQDAGLR